MSTESVWLELDAVGEIGGVGFLKKKCTKKETEPKKGTKPSIEWYTVFFLDIMDVFLGFLQISTQNKKYYNFKKFLGCKHFIYKSSY